MPDTKRVAKHGACHILRTSFSTVYSKYKQDTKSRAMQPVSPTTVKINRSKEM